MLVRIVAIGHHTLSPAPWRSAARTLAFIRTSYAASSRDPAARSAARVTAWPWLAS